MLRIFFSLLVASLTTLAQQAPPNADYDIAYEVNTGGMNVIGKAEVWVKGVRGGKGARLIVDAAQPAWSPDGGRIAYVHRTSTHNPELVVAAHDGTNPKTLVSVEKSHTLASPAWSPDGNRIAFISNKEGSANVYVADVEQLDVKRITNLEKGQSVWHPTWSPDGKRLTYALFAKGGNGIEIVDLTTSTATHLTQHDKHEHVAGQPVEDADPAWSPDGDWIAFSSNRDGKYAIFLVRPDGSDLRRLLFNSNYNFFDPVWEPDGKRLAFEMEMSPGAYTFMFPRLPRSQYPLDREVQLVDLSTHATVSFSAGRNPSFRKK